MTCAVCGKGKLAKVKVKIERDVAGRSFSTTLSSEKCSHCREVFHAGRDLVAFDHAIAAELSRTGPVSGEAFKAIRTALRLPAREVAKLLGLTPETISRWENGKGPVDRSAWAALGGMLLESMNGRSATRSRLEAATAQSRRAQRVRIKLRRVA